MIFENLEDPQCRDQKLSFLEKGFILAVIPIVKILLWKVKRAKTYGDLYKIMEFIENKGESLEEKYGSYEPIENEDGFAQQIIDDVNDIHKDLKKSK